MAAGNILRSSALLKGEGRGTEGTKETPSHLRQNKRRGFSLRPRFVADAIHTHVRRQGNDGQSKDEENDQEDEKKKTPEDEAGPEESNLLKEVEHVHQLITENSEKIKAERADENRDEAILRHLEMNEKLLLQKQTAISTKIAVEDDKLLEHANENMKSATAKMGWHERDVVEHYEEEVIHLEEEAFHTKMETEYEEERHAETHTIAMIIVSCILIFLAILFENGLHYAKHNIGRNHRILDSATLDLAAFGFTSIVFFLMIRVGIAQDLGEIIMPGEENGEAFVNVMELLDFSLFGMVVLYACFVLYMSVRAKSLSLIWRNFESDCKRRQTTSLASPTIYIESNVEHAKRLLERGVQDDAFREFLVCRSQFLENCSDMIPDRHLEVFLESHSDHAVNFGEYLERTFHILLSGDDSHGGFVAIRLITWLKLLSVLLLSSLVILSQMAYLQLFCFAMLPWMGVCLALYFYVHFESEHAAIVDKKIRLVDERKANSNATLEKKVEASRPDDMVRWLLRVVDEKKCQSETNASHGSAKFCCGSFSHFHHFALDCMRFLVLVACISISVGFAIVYEWAAQNTQTANAPIGVAELIVAISVQWLGIFVLISILDSTLCHLTVVLSVPRHKIRRQAVRDNISRLQSEASKRAIELSICVAYASYLNDPDDACTGLWLKSIATKSERFKNICTLSQKAFDATAKNGRIDVTSFLKIMKDLKRSISMRSRSEATLTTLFHIAVLGGSSDRDASDDASSKESPRASRDMKMRDMHMSYVQFSDVTKFIIFAGSVDFAIGAYSMLRRGGDISKPARVDRGIAVKKSLRASITSLRSSLRLNHNLRDLIVRDDTLVEFFFIACVLGRQLFKLTVAVQEIDGKSTTVTEAQHEHLIMESVITHCERYFGFVGVSLQSQKKNTTLHAAARKT
eukprot:g2868.t1